MTDWASELFDNARVDFPCPQCAKDVQETIGRLKNDPKLICSACGFAFTINSEQLRESMRKVNDSIEKLRKDLGLK